MAKKKKTYSSSVLTAIVCVTLIELMALMKGHNGQLLYTSIAIIAGLGGWVIPAPNQKR